jgi:hypothetical protein
MAKGNLLEIEKLFEVNFILTLNHKAFELENKKKAEFYDYRRYNI